MGRLINTGLALLPVISTLVGAVPAAKRQSSTCATKGKPSGNVLVGYWENWDNSGVHPGMGYVPIENSTISQNGYNVYMTAFPNIDPNGTAIWETGMSTGVIIPTPAEMCEAKAAGATILMSIGGENAAIDLTSSTVADTFIASIVPILQEYNFDGIDFDIESGLTGGSSPSDLSTTQSNFIKIIDGVLAGMPDNFGLTMAPETPYVTGGSVTYGSIWGSYIPIIKKYADSGRLWWLNMQYYNDDLYDCSGNSYSPGSTDGFIAQTDCLNSGLTIDGVTLTLPYDMQVPGLPAQSGAANNGYMSPSAVSDVWNHYNGALKGLMTWSINWDGSEGWTFGDNVKSLMG